MLNRDIYLKQSGSIAVKQNIEILLISLRICISKSFHVDKILKRTLLHMHVNVFDLSNVIRVILIFKRTYAAAFQKNLILSRSKLYSRSQRIVGGCMCNESIKRTI